MEAETGVMWLQAKEHLEPPETGKGKEGFFLRAFGGSKSSAKILISDFWTPEP